MAEMFENVPMEVDEVGESPGLVFSRPLMPLIGVADPSINSLVEVMMEEARRFSIPRELIVFNSNSAVYAGWMLLGVKPFCPLFPRLKYQCLIAVEFMVEKAQHLLERGRFTRVKHPYASTIVTWYIGYSPIGQTFHPCTSYRSEGVLSYEEAPIERVGALMRRQRDISYTDVSHVPLVWSPDYTFLTHSEGTGSTQLAWTRHEVAAPVLDFPLNLHSGAGALELISSPAIHKYYDNTYRNRLVEEG